MGSGLGVCFGSRIPVAMNLQLWPSAKLTLRATLVKTEAGHVLAEQRGRRVKMTRRLRVVSLIGGLVNPNGVYYLR